MEINEIAWQIANVDEVDTLKMWISEPLRDWFGVGKQRCRYVPTGIILLEMVE